MAEANQDLISAGNIAKALGVSDARVKKAIKTLALEPAAKRGVCAFYDQGAVERIKAALAEA
ncbi:MAG: hypothetical protein RLZZ501_1762 [Pseudomonadota bacterium]|jgi:Mn-dependent DtxR family transcriptional regulator